MNKAEVDATVSVIRALAGRASFGPSPAGPSPAGLLPAGRPPGAAAIGVITPFRAQAEALEAALLAAFSVEEIEELGLRTGTVHGFQGSEADLVIASLGLVDEDSPARYRFVADSSLFNVMVTRARNRMVLVTSLTRAEGVIGDYLRYAEQPPAPFGTAISADQRGVDQWGVDQWVAALAAELRRAGLLVRCGYPVGRWRVDLCVGAGADAVGLICGTHPDGVEAHLERQRTLLRAGWRLLDAFASRWSGDPVRAAVELAQLAQQAQQAQQARPAPIKGFAADQGQRHTD